MNRANSKTLLPRRKGHNKINENVHFIKTHTQLNCFATYYSLLLGDVQLIKNGCYLRQGLFSVNNR